MASGGGCAIDAMHKMRNNRALLKKKAPFEIHKRNGFITTTGKKLKSKKLTKVQIRLMRMKVIRYQKAEKKRLILTSALTVLITVLVILSSIQLTKVIF